MGGSVQEERHAVLLWFLVNTIKVQSDHIEKILVSQLAGHSICRRVAYSIYLHCMNHQGPERLYMEGTKLCHKALAYNFDASRAPC